MQDKKNARQIDIIWPKLYNSTYTWFYFQVIVAVALQLSVHMT